MQYFKKLIGDRIYLSPKFIGKIVLIIQKQSLLAEGVRSIRTVVENNYIS